MDNEYLLIDSNIPKALSVMESHIIHYDVTKDNRIEFRDAFDGTMLWDTSNVSYVKVIDNYVIIETDIGNLYCLIDIKYIDKLHRLLSDVINLYFDERR